MSSDRHILFWLKADQPLLLTLRTLQINRAKQFYRPMQQSSAALRMSSLPKKPTVMVIIHFKYINISFLFLIWYWHINFLNTLYVIQMTGTVHFSIGMKCRCLLGPLNKSSINDFCFNFLGQQVLFRMRTFNPRKMIL